MSNVGWSITYPQMIAFGVRALAVPVRGNVMCASAAIPFRLADGELVVPADWYSAVREYGGENAIPDGMAPLPGAELLVLGPVGPLPREPRECTVRCGPLERRLLLGADPEDDGARFLGADEAVWHERDNPVGRGEAGDVRAPLIRDRDHPERPIWLGPTAYDHPARQRRAGIPGEGSVGDWPADASAASLHDAHEAFWADGLFARDPLRLHGLVDVDVDVDLPPYHVSLAVCRGLADWHAVEARVHVVAVVPMAGIGAMIWRGVLDLGGDAMGEEVVAVVAALDDADAPARDPNDLAEVVMLRWQEPARALDDRPLLPPSLHHRVELPFDAAAEDSPHDASQAAAEAWALGEMGLDRNPYEDVPLAGNALAASAEEASRDAIDDVDKLTEVADAIAEQARERHKAMGFGDVAPEPHPTVARGDALGDEVERRLALPYQTPHELAVAANIRSVPSGLDADETLGKLAEARAQSPEAPLFWPALELAEAAYFGEQVLGRLGAGDLPRHVDISGAQVGDAPAADPRLGPPPDEEDMYVWDDGAKPPPLETPGTLAALERPHAVRHRRVDGLLAEETAWRGIVFEDCEFVDSSFAGARFENCEFLRCIWERVNVTAVAFVDCRFDACSLTDLVADAPVLTACEFGECRLADTSVSDAAMRDVTFRGGAWAGVQWQEGLLVNVSLLGTEVDEVTFTEVRAIHVLFEGVSMHQVSATAWGFPHATFRDVGMRRCGFGACHFDHSVWEAVRAEESGLTNCVFADAAVAADCEFRRCDFSGVAFTQADVSGARFVECTMSFTSWSGAAAERAWFFGSNLRGVHFSDARLAGAVFCDSDIRDAVFREEEIIGADFSGTRRSE